MSFGALKGTLSNFGNSITNPANANGSVSVSVGDLVFCVIAEQTALTATTCTDNLGNTYAATNAGSDPGTPTGRAYWSRVTVAGTLTQVRVAATASSNNYAIVAAVIEGSFGASPLDKNPANITNDTSSPYTCPATGSLAQNDEVVMAWMTWDNVNVHSATAPNTKALQAGSTGCSAMIGYQAVASTSSVAPAFTGGALASDVLGTSSFKQTAAAISAALPNPGRAFRPLLLR